VWEHAYYLDVQNRRPDYMTTFVDKVNGYDFGLFWHEFGCMTLAAAQRFAEGRERAGKSRRKQSAILINSAPHCPSPQLTPLPHHPPHPPTQSYTKQPPNPTQLVNWDEVAKRFAAATK
jgi:hypothetical protein